MRLVFLCLVLGTSLAFSNSSYSQSAKISLHLKDKTIKQVLSEIEKNSEFIFFYQDDILNTGRRVSVNATNETIEEILEEILSTTDNTWFVSDRSIYITKKESETTAEVVIQQQQKRITGRITDNGGQTIIGANILEVGTSNGTITDIDGHFTLLVADDAVIQVTYIGYHSLEINTSGQTVFNIILQEDTQALDEVVIVGYGTQRRESIIGSVTTVEPERLQVNQSRSISNALIGQIPGIIGIQRSGEPGYDSSDFWIRGISTFGAGAGALVIVDGIERSLDNLSPEEIESFSVLKDAAATAVYGVKGANGAIVIKTKRGTIGAPRVTVKADYGISEPVKLPSYVDGAKHMEVINAARTLSGMPATSLYTQEQIDRTREGYDPDLYPDVYWLDMVTTNHATNGRVSLDVNGGTERLRYRFILGTFHETGIIQTDPTSPVDTQLRLNKYNVRSNIDMDLTSSTLFSLSVGGFISNRNAPGTGISTILDWSMQAPPIVHPAQYSTGEYPKNVNRANPWVQATQTGYQTTYQNSIETVASIDQDLGKLWSPLDGMNLKFIFSFDAYNWNNVNRTRQPDFHIANGRDEEGNLQLILVEKGQEFLGYSKGVGGNRNVYIEVPLSYSRTFNGIHNVTGLLLYNQKDYVNSDVNTAIMAFPYRSQGIAGRFTYDYDHRYFAEVNFGYNGSENFRKGKRFGFFPSLALGWLINNEEFMKDLTFLDKLKLRGSWGIVGNDQIGGDRRFAYLTTIEGGNRYVWGYNGGQYYDGYREGEFGSPSLTWETANKMNIGLEVGVFRSLDVQFDLFKEDRSNIFMQRKILPEIAGYNNTPWANFGKVENKGFDMIVEYNKQFNRNFYLGLMGNLTYASNKIMEFDEAAGIIGTNRARTGQNINQNYGLIADRLYLQDDFIDPVNGVLKPGIPTPNFGSVKPGDIKYVDVNNDNVVDANDISPIGEPTIPKTVYGAGLTARYKNLDFGILLQGMANVNFIISGNEMIPGSGDGSIGNILTNVDDRWTPENPAQDVFYPRLSQTRSENNTQASTWWIEDGAYVRLKNIELGYSLPSSFNLPVQNARVFARGSNLLTFAPFKLWDPELGGTGYRSYPVSKIVTIGFDITF